MIILLSYYPCCAKTILQDAKPKPLPHCRLCPTCVKRSKMHADPQGECPARCLAPTAESRRRLPALAAPLDRLAP
jgi:hypothetical protein